MNLQKKYKMIIFLYKISYIIFFISLLYSLVIITISKLNFLFFDLYKTQETQQDDWFVMYLKDNLLLSQTDLYYDSMIIFLSIITIYIINELLELFLSKTNYVSPHCKLFRLYVPKKNNNFVLEHEKLHCYFADSLIFYISRVIIFFLIILLKDWIIMAIASLYLIHNFSLFLLMLAFIFFTVFFIKNILKVMNNKKGLFEMLADIYAYLITNNFNVFKRKIMMLEYDLKLSTIFILVIYHIIISFIFYRYNDILYILLLMVDICIIILHIKIIRFYKTIVEGRKI